MPHEVSYAFTFHDSQRDRFRSGALAEEWAQRHPHLFDVDDLRVLKTADQRKYHFLEWLAAILLFEATGYRSLVEKYTARRHPGKRHILAGIVQPDVFKWLSAHETGQPDLFVYSPATLDWFLCEVKGPNDKVRDSQRTWDAAFQAFLRSEHIPAAGRTRLLNLHRARA